MTPLERDDWTYAEGLGNLARFLMVRLPAAALVVIGGSALVANLRPYDGEFATALVPVAGLIGAGASIYKSTLLDM